MADNRTTMVTLNNRTWRKLSWLAGITLALLVGLNQGSALVNRWVTPGPTFDEFADGSRYLLRDFGGRSRELMEKQVEVLTKINENLAGQIKLLERIYEEGRQRDKALMLLNKDLELGFRRLENELQRGHPKNAPP